VIFVRWGRRRLSELVPVRPEADAAEDRLTSLVLNAVTSPHSRRAYATDLAQFFAWLGTQPPQAFSKALLQEYRTWLLEQELSPATINLRLSPIRKLASEMADNGLLDSGAASAIQRTQGVKQQGVKAGNWLVKEQANELLNAPDPRTLKGQRDRAILGLLICCGLRRAELLRLAVDHIQPREGRWVIPDLRGKGNRLRTVAAPAAVKVRIEEWTGAAAIYEGKIFHPVNKADRVVDQAIADEKAIWRWWSTTPRPLLWVSLRRMICGAPAPSSAARRVGNSNRSSGSWVTPPSRPPSATWGRNRT
jgi:integrase